MLTDALNTLLSMISSLPPAAGFIAIVLATFILEDVAIVGTALLASTGMVDPWVGLGALLCGIVLGDLGLFGLGAGAAKMPGLRRYVDTSAAQRLRSLGMDRTFSLVFTTRFVPGMRLPTYTSLGYVGASFWRFSGAVVFAVTAWTIAVYSIVYFFGQNVIDRAGPWKYALIGLVILAVIIIERILIRHRRERAGDQDGEVCDAAPQ